MQPEAREGSLFTLRRRLPTLADYAVALASDRPLHVTIKHPLDGYEETRPFVVTGVVKSPSPKPHVITGVQEYDLNRPGQDGGDDAVTCECVHEMWNYPCTYLYAADGYTVPEVMYLRDVSPDSLFRICPNGVDDPDKVYLRTVEGFEDPETGEARIPSEHDHTIVLVVSPQVNIAA